MRRPMGARSARACGFGLNGVTSLVSEGAVCKGRYGRMVFALVREC